MFDSVVDQVEDAAFEHFPVCVQFNDWFVDLVLNFKIV